MRLPDARVGAYVRALHAGLDGLAPHEDYVPLSEALAHLRALDPELSHDVLFPAEVVRETGMPAFVWMERAVSERALALRDGEIVDDVQLARAEQLDRELARRMRARRDLHRHLARWPLLPTTRVSAAVRALEPFTEITCAYDRMAPDGRWLRIRMLLRGPKGLRRLGPMDIDRRARVHYDEGLIHLLTRHSLTPLLALQTQLKDALGCDVVRLSRSFVGPFWFPGVLIPQGVPEGLGRGLLLHLSTEVVAENVHHAVHLDPLIAPDPSEKPPAGQQIFRERRFAASAPLVPLVEAWGASKAVRNVIVTIGPRSGRTL